MQLDRIISLVEGEQDGPSVICSAGMHGNEWVTVYAASIVAARLAALEIRGRVMFVRGNLAALTERRRYLDADFNRLWTEENVARLESGEGLPEQVSEFREMEQLHPILDSFYAASQGENYMVDLHAASSLSQPFSIVTDPGESYRYALGIDVPCVLWTNRDDLAQGGLISWAARRGYTGIAFEAGPIGHEQIATSLVACLWHALVKAGVVQASQISDFDDISDSLGAHQDGVPQALEIVYQHLIEPSDSFSMEPGFTNFQMVRQGQLLARDARGPIFAEHDSHVLFPLYQETGDYGFLLTRGKNSE